jgi:hypothetical protein
MFPNRHDGLQVHALKKHVSQAGDCLIARRREWLCDLLKPAMKEVRQKLAIVSPSWLEWQGYDLVSDPR